METLLFIAGLIEKLPCRNSRIFERFVETVRRQEALHTYVDTNGFTERTRRIREQLSVGTNLFTEEDVEAWVVNVTQLVRQDETFTITLDSIPD